MPITGARGGVMATTNTLTEVLFVVHFAAPPNMTVLDLAAWHQAFSDYAILQQTPAAPPPQLAQYGQPVLTMVQDPGMPRVVLRSIDHPFIVQLQSDRFGMSWSRDGGLGEVKHYLGYKDLKARFSEELNRLDAWHSSRFGVQARFRLIEVGYYNALPFELASGDTRRLSDVFLFVAPGRPINAFAANWTEIMGQGSDAPRVVAQTGVGVIAQQPSLTSTNVIYFNFTGIGALPNVGSDDPTVVEVADRLHDRIFTMYQAAIKSTAS